MASNHTSTEAVDVELLAVPARWLAVGVDFAQHRNDRESRRSHLILVVETIRELYMLQNTEPPNLENLNLIAASRWPQWELGMDFIWCTAVREFSDFRGHRICTTLQEKLAYALKTFGWRSTTRHGYGGPEGQPATLAD
jgi:hypothetical protein